jgi:plasmid maintenance system antidote protein VapI
MSKAIVPMNDEERAVADRVRRVRYHVQLSVREFSERLGVTNHRMAAIDYQRTPLSFVIAEKLEQVFDVNLMWLAEGKGPMTPKLYGRLDISGVPRSAVFLEVYRAKIKADIEATTEIAMRALYAHVVNRPSKDFMGPSAPIDQIATGILQVLRAELGKLPVYGQTQLLTELLYLIRHYRKGWQSSAAEKQLTETSENRKSEDEMKPAPTLRQLLGEVRRLTKATGMKTQLAKALGVPQARVSEWLAGKYEPSGDTALRLFNWVNSSKRKK